MNEQVGSDIAMKNAFKILAIIVFLTAATPALPRDGDESVGVWRNAQNSVHLEAHHCGEGMCGKVIWANDKALADARSGGTENLLGTELFREFRRDAKGNWHGKVFVPDLNRTFSGTVVLLDHITLKGTGCLIGGIGCKSQMLTRIE
jgi:uncharacterized protein (DUF2147 family)